MRRIHLDFHTSPFIEGIGERFCKEEFTKTIKNANIDLVTVFAKCHHGYTYYPSKVAPMHPGLKFNLLAEEIEAIHAAGARAPIYITLGWSQIDAEAHPEWRMVDFELKKVRGWIPEEHPNPDAPRREVSWTCLCPFTGYSEHLEAITREVCENFDVSDGIFYDICFAGRACVCETCKAGMRELGLDPENYDDAKKYYADRHVEMMKKYTAIVHEYSKDAPVFYNSGGANIDRPEYHAYETHYELEDLPTAWGGYDLMPIRAKFFERYGKPFIGMTGKFHHSWGEFGGFKSKEALRYELADMMSVGAAMSVGDHLHPSGELDASTYAIIGDAFAYTKEIEQYCKNTRAYTDLAIWISKNNDSDVGASKILQDMHLEYDVLDTGEGDKLSKYKCVILPDRVAITDDDKAALIAYVNGGGKVIASYASVFDELGIRKIAPSQYNPDYIKCDSGVITTPFLAYSGAYITESDGEYLAEVYEPYFNRTVGKYCGHKNTPYTGEPAEYPALIRRGNVLYFAHPVFEAYNKSGSYVLEEYVIRAIDSIYERQIETVELPTLARVRLRADLAGDFLALHLLYAPPVNRGIACMLPDFPKVCDAEITLHTDKAVSDVFCAPSGEKVPFTYSDGKLTMQIPSFKIHTLIVIK